MAPLRKSETGSSLGGNRHIFIHSEDHGAGFAPRLSPHNVVLVLKLGDGSAEDDVKDTVEYRRGDAVR